MSECEGTMKRLQADRKPRYTPAELRRKHLVRARKKIAKQTTKKQEKRRLAKERQHAGVSG